MVNSNSYLPLGHVNQSKRAKRARSAVLGLILGLGSDLAVIGPCNHQQPTLPKCISRIGTRLANAKSFFSTSLHSFKKLHHIKIFDFLGSTGGRERSNRRLRCQSSWLSTPGRPHTALLIGSFVQQVLNQSRKNLQLPNCCIGAVLDLNDDSYQVQS